ncbi:butyrophilin-like protein 2 [Megalobrama amblycephala]|uniref:butyrophilin-like protein 2 n=1 Tax=Megalobrama amblycephala TaxID=75352 RepID=UPI0020141371|nr:butyrophilin-like protein 2 [Megalobrama amblycephala]
MDLLMFIFVAAAAVKSDGLTVRGPSGPLVDHLGSSVVLPCYVDEPLLTVGLEVEWRRTDSETLVHLYQDGESRPDAQQEEYHDRAHFFTDQIQHGNFSLRLDKLRAEDEGKYTCKVYSQQESGETEVQIKVDDVERLLVSGSSHSISASVGEDVTLSCSVDSHIKPEDTEVSWKKTDEDEDILVLLYQDHEPLPGSSDEQYRDRVEFFTDEIPKGNFSLRLKSVRAEDKGVYMCQVFAGGLSANATVVLERLDSFLSSYFYVKVSSAPLVFPLGSSVVLPCYCDKPSEGLKLEWRKDATLVQLYPDRESQPEEQHKDYHDRAHFFTDQIQHGNFSLRLNKLRAEDEGTYRCRVYSEQRSVFSTYATLEPKLLDSFLRLHLSLAVCPNMIMFFAFVFWGVSEGSVNETVCCCALYFLRPLLILWAAPYINKFADKIKTWILKYSYVAEYVVFSVVAYSALFSTAWQKLLNFAVFDRVVIIVLFSVVFLCCSCKIIYLLVTEIGKKEGRIIEIFNLVADMISDILPTLQFILLFYTFGSCWNRIHHHCHFTSVSDDDE